MAKTWSCISSLFKWQGDKWWPWEDFFRLVTIREKSLVSKTPRPPSEGMKVVFWKVQTHQSTGFTGFALKMSLEFVVRFAQHNSFKDVSKRLTFRPGIRKKILHCSFCRAPWRALEKYTPRCLTVRLPLKIFAGFQKNWILFHSHDFLGTNSNYT